jgi:hypothetical protein
MGNFDALEEKKLWLLGIFQDSRHSAPLPVTTAATAQHTRSTANAAISGVLQQAITPRQAIAPRQEVEDKMEVSGNGTAATQTLKAGPEQPDLKPPGPAHVCLGSRVLARLCL